MSYRYTIFGIDGPRGRKALGQALLEAREQRGWGQGVIAERAGVSVATVSRTEAGKVDSSRDKLEKLIDAYDTPSEKLKARVHELAASFPEEVELEPVRPPRTERARAPTGRMYDITTPDSEMAVTRLPGMTAEEARAVKIARMLYDEITANGMNVPPQRFAQVLELALESGPNPSRTLIRGMLTLLVENAK